MAIPHSGRGAILAKECTFSRLNGKCLWNLCFLFEKHGVYSYIKQYFESLHTMGDYYIVQDIDDYIRDTDGIYCGKTDS